MAKKNFMFKFLYCLKISSYTSFSQCEKEQALLLERATLKLTVIKGQAVFTNTRV